MSFLVYQSHKNITNRARPKTKKGAALVKRQASFARMVPWAGCHAHTRPALPQTTRPPKFLGATWTSQRSVCPRKESGEGQPTEVALSGGWLSTRGARRLTLARRVCWQRWGQCGASRRQSSQTPSLAGLNFKAGSKITLDIVSGCRGE